MTRETASASGTGTATGTGTGTETGATEIATGTAIHVQVAAAGATTGSLMTGGTEEIVVRGDLAAVLALAPANVLARLVADVAHTRALSLVAARDLVHEAVIVVPPNPSRAHSVGP